MVVIAHSVARPRRSAHRIDTRTESRRRDDRSTRPPRDPGGRHRGHHDLRGQENIPTKTEQSRRKSQPPETEGLTAGTDHPYLTGISSTAAVAASTASATAHSVGKELGLRKQTDESKDVSLANSEDEAGASRKKKQQEKARKQEGNGDLEGVQPYFGKDGGDDDSSKKS